MDYIKIRFGSDLEQLETGFGRTVEEMFRSVNPLFRFAEQTWKPQMDIYETPDEIHILAEISGVDKENLVVEICNKAVKIQGNRLELPRGGNATYRLAEIQYGKFERTLFLPAPINPDNVKASCSNGFLRICLAKLPRDKTHKIHISDK